MPTARVSGAHSGESGRGLARLLVESPVNQAAIGSVYMTRVRWKTSLISSSVGTRPNSSCMAMAIFALRSRSLLSLTGAAFFNTIVKIWSADCSISFGTLAHAQ
jgi:hypothetical protein